MSIDGRYPDLSAIYTGTLFRLWKRSATSSGLDTTSFEYAERPPGVRAIVTDGFKVLLTREWRPEFNGYDYRLPGGKVFDSIESYLAAQGADAGLLQSSIRAAAQRELMEETGLRIPLDQFVLHYHSICGATIFWDLFYFVVTVPGLATCQSSVMTEEEGLIMTSWFTFPDIVKLCLACEIREDRTVAVLLKYILRDPRSDLGFGSYTHETS